MVFTQEDITKEIEIFLLMKIIKTLTESMSQATAPSERLLYLPTCQPLTNIT